MPDGPCCCLQAAYAIAPGDPRVEPGRAAAARAQADQLLWCWVAVLRASLDAWQGPAFYYTAQVGGAAAGGAAAMLLA